MGATPDQLKANIEQTQAELAADVDTLTGRVNPANIARRQAGAVRSSVAGVKERVMGSTGSVSDTASSVTGSVQQAPTAVRSRTAGNPLAMGLIAFGAGVLAATVIPTTRPEEELAGQVKDTVAQPLTDAAKGSAHELKDQLAPAAQDAVEQVKDTATDAAGATADHAKSAAGDVRSTAKESADETRQTAQRSTG